MEKAMSEDAYGEIAKYYDMIYGADIDYAEEARGLHHLFRDNRASRVLDLACGTGSHLVRLAEYGYTCAGVDISAGMLEKAREKAAARGLSVDFKRGDMRHLQPGETFDAVFSLYAVGLNSGLSETGETLRNVCSFLEKDGLFVFNVMNGHSPLWDESRPDNLTFDAGEEKDVKVLWMYKTVYERDFQRMDATYVIVDGGRSSMVVHHHEIRNFTVESVETLLQESGLRLESVYGSLTDLQTFNGHEPAMTVLARKI